jgi:rsbT co-antagonist protein RsbR
MNPNMRALLLQLIVVHHAHEDAQRRGRNIIILAWGLILFAILSVTYSAFIDALSWRIIIPFVVSLAVHAGVIVLARGGRVDRAGGIIVGMAIVGITGSAILNEERFILLILFPISLLIATATLPPLGIIISLVGVLSGIGLVIGISPSPHRALSPSESALFRDMLVFTIGMTCMLTALIGVLISTGHERLQRRLQDEARRADQSAQALQQLNNDLDRRVHMQTEALQKMVQELEERAAQQERLLQEITAQREIIRELSLPILPVGRDILAAPLVGAFDGERLQQLQTTAFQRVEQTRAHILILDVTGVPVIDTHVAQGLAGLIQGVRLLGAETFLVGMRPEVAQTIVGFGIHFRDVSIFRDLESAISCATLRR